MVFGEQRVRNNVTIIVCRICVTSTMAHAYRDAWETSFMGQPVKNHVTATVRADSVKETDIALVCVRPGRTGTCAKMRAQ